ncbi:MAG: tetratricopeptide repeat protein [Gammaproteobacteria bacterium]|nr:tetratricopeptide repeat protein [Gammaproteobacteria bacterium]MDH3768279.1 tetratricopeptide repeat protein [Gammaproteobacteria bacterium]
MAKRNKQRAFALAIQSSDHLIAEKHYRAAANILERYLGIYPPQATVLRRLGQVRLYQGRPEDAVPLLAHALRIELAIKNAA